MVACVHVTHEAVRQSGGIGTVLRGLLTTGSYRQRVGRTLLLGPLEDSGARELSAPDNSLLYDSARQVRYADASAALDRVAAAHGVRLVYGVRQLRDQYGETAVEVLLVDVEAPGLHVDAFKYYLSEHFGLDSRRYEVTPEYERYLRLAEPGFEGIRALLGSSDELCWLIGHEFMGVCTLLKSMLAGDQRFRTAFYAHEVATVRMLVEDTPGRDIMFYNVLRLARREGGYLTDHFGPQEWYHKHALISQAWRCDALLAVGDWVVEELRFLGPDFDRHDISLVYNGIPSSAVPREARAESRQRLERYVEALLGYRPDWIFTHVTRLVSSKALWRDLLVLRGMDNALVQRGQRAVLLMLATEVGRRQPEAVWRMAAEYGWPLVHREGYPDLTPGELQFDFQVRALNAACQAVSVIYINQFGFDQSSCGPAMPADMSFADIRQGTDAEFGQSIYEPFGIAMLEPLNAGAISVISDACGCLGFLERTVGRDFAALVEGQYTRLEDTLDIRMARNLGAEERDRAEVAESHRVAELLLERLSADPETRDRLLRQGHEAAQLMSWECVAEQMFLPALGI